MKEKRILFEKKKEKKKMKKVKRKLVRFSHIPVIRQREIDVDRN